MQIADKSERQAAEDALRDEVLAGWQPRFADVATTPRSSSRRLPVLTKAVVRRRIVEEGVRIDGRGPADLRPLSAEVGVLPPRTAPGCSSGARPRCSTSPRWA
jgi:polyribonucleotide nucleotidyltransferase